MEKPSHQPPTRSPPSPHSRPWRRRRSPARSPPPSPPIPAMAPPLPCRLLLSPSMPAHGDGAPLLRPALRFGEARPRSSRDLAADPSAGMGVASVANGIEGKDYFVVKVGEAAADGEPDCEHGSSSPWRRRPWRSDVKQPHSPVEEASRPCAPFLSPFLASHYNPRLDLLGFNSEHQCIHYMLGNDVMLMHGAPNIHTLVVEGAARRSSEARNAGGIRNHTRLCRSARRKGTQPNI